MNIMFYWPFDLNKAGGVENHIKRLTENLILLGHQVNICSGSEKEYLPACEILHSHGDRIPPQKLIKQTKRWIHTLHGTSFGRLIACREWFGLSAYAAAVRESYAINSAHAVISVSELVLTESRRYLLNTNANVRVIHNGADLLSPSEATVSDKSLDDEYVLFLGRANDRVKNADRIVGAVNQLKSVRKNLKLYVAPGTGFEAYRYDWIIPLGPLDQEQSMKYLSYARALLLPSLYEADPLVAWECMALGKKAVITDYLEHHAVFSKYDGFHFVNPRDTVQICQAIDEILNRSETQRPIVRTWMTVAKETELFYLQNSR
jgi:glycosyltransferase involved in cell wall biosynthesis